MKTPEARSPLVPELRFPEFRDAGPWEVKRLGELVETVTPPKKLQTSEYLPSGRFPIIDQSPSDVCGWTDDETALVQADFPLVVFGDHSCVVKLADGPFAQGADGIRILAPISDIEARFLFLSLQADPIEQKGYRRHFSTLKEKQIPFPGKDMGEQQKIVDCLSSLDDLIRTEGERLAALKDHKRALMQHLFPRPGETTPRMRFPEFRDAGPWEVKRLGEMGTMLKGKGIAKFDVKPDGSLPCIRYGEIYTIYGETISDVVSRTDAEAADLVLSEEGDVIIPASGETKEDIATASCVAKAGVALGSDLNVFRSSLSGSFLAYYIRGNLKPLIRKVAQGDSVVHLYPAQLDKLQLAIPSSLPEQQKIADCLTALDDLIRAQGERIEAVRSHKRGLMQRLFPRPDEASPRLRFPEFHDAGPWEVKRLGDEGIARFIRDRVAAEDVPSGHYVSTVNLLPDFGGLSPEPEKPPPGSAIAYCEGDILMSNIRPYLRKIWVADRSGGASNDVLVARPGKSVVKSFLSQLLMSERFISHVMDGAKGVKMPRGDLEQIQDFAVPLPAKPEQQKIADCLTAFDDLIRTQGETIEALKTHKRGLMNRLFPREVG